MANTRSDTKTARVNFTKVDEDSTRFTLISGGWAQAMLAKDGHPGEFLYLGAKSPNLMEEQLIDRVAKGLPIDPAMYWPLLRNRARIAASNPKLVDTLDRVAAAA
jgi:hypothetical protein